MSLFGAQFMAQLVTQYMAQSMTLLGTLLMLKC
jgi:hypothetical protein